MPEGYITTEEVAKIHGVTKGRVTQWIREGKLVAEKSTGYLIKEEDALAFNPPPITGRPKSNV